MKKRQVPVLMFAALITESGIDIPSAVRCSRALNDAIHAGEKPEEILDAYPAGWAIVPGTIGQTGAYFFHESQPDQARFTAPLVADEHGGFMEFWGDEQTTRETAARGKQVLDRRARGALANFLATRLIKINSRLEALKSQASAPSEPAEKVTLPDSIRAIVADAIDGKGGMSQQNHVPKNSRELLFKKIIEGGQASLAEGELALFKKGQKWDKASAKWNEANAKWIRDGKKGEQPPYPDGALLPEEEEKYRFELIDRVEAAGLAQLKPEEQQAWKEFKTPQASGQGPAGDRADAQSERAQRMNRENQELLGLVDNHVRAFATLAQGEQINVTPESFRQGLQTCAQVQGDETVRKLARGYLELLDKPAPAQGQAPSESSAGAAN